MNSKLAFNAMKKCETRFIAADAAMRYYIKNAKMNRSILLDQIFHERDLTKSLYDLDQTYTIRLFAIFEDVLRDFWKIGLHNSKTLKMEHLMSKLRSIRKIDEQVYLQANDVREHRNKIVHEGGSNRLLTFKDCLRRLNHFVAYLPHNW